MQAYHCHENRQCHYSLYGDHHCSLSGHHDRDLFEGDHRNLDEDGSEVKGPRAKPMFMGSTDSKVEHEPRYKGSWGATKLAQAKHQQTKSDAGASQQAHPAKHDTASRHILSDCNTASHGQTSWK